MEIWLDTCCVNTIKEANRFGIFFGITTNPSIIAKSNQDPEKIVTELLDIQDGPVAVQVTAENAEEMIFQAQALNAQSERIVVKVPATAEGLIAVKNLSREEIPTMLTAVFHPNQALLGALAGTDYIAPYLGRMVDGGIDAFTALQTMLKIYQNYSCKTKILAAALKNTDHITLCAEMGVQAITIKEERLQELLTENPSTIEACEIFNHDWKMTMSKFPSKSFCLNR